MRGRSPARIRPTNGEAERERPLNGSWKGAEKIACTLWSLPLSSARSPPARPSARRAPKAAEAEVSVVYALWEHATRLCTLWECSTPSHSRVVVRACVSECVLCSVVLCWSSVLFFVVFVVFSVWHVSDRQRSVLSPVGIVQSSHAASTWTPLQVSVNCVRVLSTKRPVSSPDAESCSASV